jgi:hypothetical protein
MKGQQYSKKNRQTEYQEKMCLLFQNIQVTLIIYKPKDDLERKSYLAIKYTTWLFP